MTGNHNRKGASPTSGDGLATAVAKRGLWPTPTVNTRPNEGSVRLLRAKVLAGTMTQREAMGLLHGKDPLATHGKLPALLPTPRASDGSKGSPNQLIGGRPTLSNIAAHYPTPTARDWRSGACSAQTLKRHSLSLPDETACREGNGKLNPGWVEWLMGYPIGWTAFVASATPSSPRSRSSSAGGLA